MHRTQDTYPLSHLRIRKARLDRARGQAVCDFEER